MNHEPTLKAIQSHWPQTLRLYLIGFISCLFLTTLSFSLAAFKFFSTPTLMALLVFLAILQAFTQLIYFMHMGKEAKPRWMMLLFYLMVLLLSIVVIGSLWIIYDLDARTMPAM